MQRALEKSVAILIAGDCNHAGFGELLLQDRNGRLVAEVERLVTDHPFRLVEEEAGDGELPLLVYGQFLLPARASIQGMRAPSKTGPLKCGDKLRLGEFRWILRRGEGVAERARRHIKLLRQERGRRVRWQLQCAFPPRPEPGKGAKQGALPATRRADNADTLTGCDLNRLLRKPGDAVGQ